MRQHNGHHCRGDRAEIVHSISRVKDKKQAKECAKICVLSMAFYRKFAFYFHVFEGARKSD